MSVESEENVFENIVCRMGGILSQPQHEDWESPTSLHVLHNAFQGATLEKDKLASFSITPLMRVCFIQGSTPPLIKVDLWLP